VNETPEERIPTPMPVLFIEGPAGLNATSKRALVKKTVAAMFAAYQMPDDRVYIREYTIENGGHTGLDVQDGHQLHDPEPARPVLTMIAPPDLPLDAKRKMIQDLTEAVTEVYHISDKRDILIFLQEHPLENAANNGFLQTENPAFAVPGVQ
jgi:phenylpyruvate tautomerase PptA (4-oxalocrotonate tautomerase family)